MTKRYEMNGLIDDDKLRDLLWFLQNEVPESCEELEVRICSHGGSVSVGLAMAGLLHDLPIRVRTVNLSRVDSSAIMIFAAGDERVCYSHSGFFLHEVGKECSGTKTIKDLLKMVKEIKFDTNRVISFLAYRTGIDSEHWKSYMDNGVLLTADKAVELGLATKIITHEP